MSDKTPFIAQEPFQPGAARRHLAANLRLFRLLRRWSQEDLAEAAGLDRTFIGSIERAERNVGLDTLEKLAHATGMTIASLIAPPYPQRIGDELLEAVRKAVNGTLRISEEVAIYLIHGNSRPAAGASARH